MKLETVCRYILVNGRRDMQATYMTKILYVSNSKNSIQKRALQLNRQMSQKETVFTVNQMQVC